MGGGNGFYGIRAIWVGDGADEGMIGGTGPTYRLSVRVLCVGYGIGAIRMERGGGWLEERGWGGGIHIDGKLAANQRLGAGGYGLGEGGCVDYGVGAVRLGAVGLAGRIGGGNGSDAGERLV